MNPWRRRFTAIVFTAAVLSQLPLTVTTWHGLLNSHAHVWTQAVWFSLLTVTIANVALVQRLRSWTDHRPRSWVKTWLVELPYFIYFGAGWFWILALVPAVVAWGTAQYFAWTTLEFSRLLYALAGVSYLAGTYGVLVRKWWTPVVDIQCEVSGLDPSLDGLVIAQLSDLHCGPNMPRWFLRHLARRASNVGADIVVMTGDFITEGEGYLQDVTYVANEASAPLGVFCSLGNHDYFGTTEGVASAITSSHATLLRNTGVVLTRKNGGQFYLAGIDDTWTHRDSLQDAMRECPENMGTVLLAHDPLSFPPATKNQEVRVVLSGHTHGGQLSVPFLSRLTNLGRVRYPHSLGLFHSADKRCALYVHPGNGTSGPPIRFGVAPVIARITLRAVAKPT